MKLLFSDPQTGFEPALAFRCNSNYV